MPRPNQRRVDRLPTAGSAPVSNPQAADVVSRASAPSIVAPAETAQLLDALKHVEPGINAFLEKKQAEREESERLAGQKARTAQQGNQVALTPEQTPWFQQGYMEVHGQVAGAEVARKMATTFEAERRKPGFDPEQALQKIVSDELQGLTDKDALKGFLPVIARQREAIRSEWAKQQLEDVRVAADQQLMALARDQVYTPFAGEEVTGTDTPTMMHARYQQFVERGLRIGKTRPELAEVFAQNLINRAVDEGDPSVLAVADIRDSSGIALRDNPAIAARLVKAREAAEAVQKKTVMEGTVGARTDVLHNLMETLRASPNDAALDYENLRRHQGPYLLFNDKDGKDLEAFYQKVLEARQAAGVNTQLLTALDGPDGRIAAAQPEAKPLIEARYGQVWDQWKKDLAAGDQAATTKFIIRNLSLHQHWGVGDARLKALLSNIPTEPSKDGKPSPDFLRVYDVYSAIQQSPNKALIADLTDERSRTLLRNFHDMIALEGVPMNDALSRAAELSTPEVQERIKSLATPETRAAFRSELESTLKGGSWFSLGLTGRAPNRDLFIATMTNVFERKLGYLGDRERAMKQTLESVEEYLTRDSNDNWTLRPDTNVLRAAGKSHADFEKGLQAYTTDLGEQLQKEGKINPDAEEPFYLERIGQGNAYLVKLNGTPVGRVELSELLARGAASNITGAEARTLSELAKHAKSGRMTGEEVDTRQHDLMKLREVGLIDARDFERLQAKRRKFQKDTLQNDVGRTRELQKGALGGMDPKDILAEPGSLPEDPESQPGGKNLKTADYAMQALQKDNLTFALTAQAEGFKTVAYGDPARGRNIGLGFSLTARSKPETASMLRRAGVPAGDVEAVMNGKMEVKPEVVVRLHEIAVDEYRSKAMRAIGVDAWKQLKPEAQAVLTDMAWATGKPKQFTDVLDAMRKGDWDRASAELSLTYTDRKGERKNDTRRVRLWRLMLSGRDTFAQYLQKHTSK
jgi:GH24 family phage-related lysozyme (muramidase)